jgi:hypothetical protein
MTQETFTIIPRCGHWNSYATETDVKGPIPEGYSDRISLGKSMLLQRRCLNSADVLATFPKTDDFKKRKKEEKEGRKEILLSSTTDHCR